MNNIFLILLQIPLIKQVNVSTWMRMQQLHDQRLEHIQGY